MCVCVVGVEGVLRTLDRSNTFATLLCFGVFGFHSVYVFMTIYLYGGLVFFFVT